MTHTALMDRSPRLNLDDFLPLWQRKLAHPLHEPEIDSLARRYMNVALSSGGERGTGDTRALTQDIVSALIIRQGGGKGSL